MRIYKQQNRTRHCSLENSSCANAMKRIRRFYQNQDETMQQLNHKVIITRDGGNVMSALFKEPTVRWER